MKKVLVMGVNGTFGRHTAKALMGKGFEVRAFMRDPQKVPSELSSLEVIQGDVLDVESIKRACLGIDVIVYGINPANYDWDNKAIPYLDHVITVAEENEIAVVFPGNVYVFNPKDGSNFDESAMQNPATSKGRIRKVMEEHLQAAATRGLKVIILRMGNFIAPDSKSSWLPLLIKANKGGYSLECPSNSRSVRVNWAYVPDAARVVVQLISKLEALPNFNVFHFEGFNVSSDDLASSIRKISGKKVNTKAFPWWFFRLGSPFSKLFKGLVEMRYLWNQEVSMKDTKLCTLLDDDFMFTDLDKALLESRLVY